MNDHAGLGVLREGLAEYADLGTYVVCTEANSADGVNSVEFSVTVEGHAVIALKAVARNRRLDAPTTGAEGLEASEEHVVMPPYRLPRRDMYGDERYAEEVARVLNVAAGGAIVEVRTMRDDGLTAARKTLRGTLPAEVLKLRTEAASSFKWGRVVVSSVEQAEEA